MKRLLLITLIAFIFTLNASIAETAKSEENAANFSDNIEQSQDQEEFYQLDQDELNQMGYELNTDRNKTSEQTPNPEEEADSVSLDSQTDSLPIPPSSEKLFIIGVEKTKEYDEVKAVNMFWYNSKNFSNTYYQDYRNALPMPILLNSSYIMNEMGKGTNIYVGQSSLSGFNDMSVGFIRGNETTYDNGAKIVNKSKLATFTAGIYDSTFNHSLSGGAAISSSPIKIRNIKGSFIFGGGYYTNELDTNNKNTAGIFGQYRLNRLRLNLQAAKSKYSNSDNLETSLYFTPEFQLTDSISIKTRFITNISQETNQNEIGLSYKPKKNNLRDLEIEFNAANTYANSQPDKPKFRFMAKFRV